MELVRMRGFGQNLMNEYIEYYKDKPGAVDTQILNIIEEAKERGEPIKTIEHEGVTWIDGTLEDEEIKWITKFYKLKDSNHPRTYHYMIKEAVDRTEIPTEVKEFFSYLT